MSRATIIDMVGDFHPKPMLWLLIILVLIGFAAAATYLGRESRELAKGLSVANNGSLRKQVRTYTVYYDFSVFSPTNIRIHVGDSVKFQNDSNRPIRIVSDFEDVGQRLLDFDSGGEILPGDSFSFTFTKEGVFGYHNIKNENEKGTVIVRP